MNKIFQGDCLEVLKELEDNSVDSIICDPPYELGFMGKSWDNTGIANNKDMWAECLRVLKPGGYLLSFGGTRTYHRMACAIEDAGFEVRDMIEWVMGSGFPKSLNIFKQLEKRCDCGIMSEYGERTTKNTKHYLRPLREADIQKAKHITEEQREVLFKGLPKQGLPTEEVREGLFISERAGEPSMEGRCYLFQKEGELYRCAICQMSTGVFSDGEKGWLYNGAPTCNGNTHGETFNENGSSASREPQSRRQQDREPCAFCKQFGAQAIRAYGWGSAMKPAHEPICVARKPLSESNIAYNFLKYGTGGINIDESRVSTDYYLQGNDLSDIISICQLNHLQSSANNAELKKFQDDTTNVIKNLFSVAENVDMPILEKTLGRLQEDTTRMDIQCYEEMLGDNISTSLNMYTLGRNITEQSRKDLKYIISTVLKMITDWKIYNVSAYQLTEVLLTRAKNEVNTREKSARFPANFIHDNSEEVRECFPDAGKGNGKGVYNYAGKEYDNKDTSMFNGDKPQAPSNFNDSGNASRFFKSIIYQAKASKSERNKGCEGLEENIGVGNYMAGAKWINDPRHKDGGYMSAPSKPQTNSHPTVKPIALMEYLIKMVTPKGGIVLDPFAGSGSTLVAAKQNGFNYIGIEMTEEYIPIIEARLKSTDDTLFSG